MNKKHFFALILSIILQIQVNLFAATFNGSINLGLGGGRVSELLRDSKSDVSQLNWDEKVSIYTQLSGELDIKNFVLSFNAGLAVPNGWGVVRDYDFISSSISQYSQHDNHLDKNFSVALDIGYNFKIRNFAFIPRIGVYYQNRKYSGWAGYKQDPLPGNSFTGNEEKQSITGNGLSYEQQILLPILKIKTVCRLGEGWSLSGLITYSPYVFADCLDSHYVRGKQFYDKIRGGYLIGGEVSISFRSYYSSLSYDYMKSSSNSQTYQTDIGVGSPSGEPVAGYTPGIASSLWGFKFGYVF